MNTEENYSEAKEQFSKLILKVIFDINEDKTPVTSELLESIQYILEQN